MKKDNKTIGLTVRFFTNGLPPRVGNTQEHIPCWSSGSVNVESNTEKGITSTGSVKLFNSMEELPKAIEKALSTASIVIVSKK